LFDNLYQTSLICLPEEEGMQRCWRKKQEEPKSLVEYQAECGFSVVKLVNSITSAKPFSAPFEKVFSLFGSIFKVELMPVKNALSIPI